MKKELLQCFFFFLINQSNEHLFFCFDNLFGKGDVQFVNQSKAWKRRHPPQNKSTTESGTECILARPVRGQRECYPPLIQNITRGQVDDRGPVVPSRWDSLKYRMVSLKMLALFIHSLISKMMLIHAISAFNMILHFLLFNTETKRQW